MRARRLPLGIACTATALLLGACASSPPELVTWAPSPAETAAFSDADPAPRFALAAGDALGVELFINDVYLATGRAPGADRMMIATVPSGLDD